MDINRSNSFSGSRLPENHSNNINSSFTKSSPTKLCQNDKQNADIETFSDRKSDTIVSPNRYSNGDVFGINDSKNQNQNQSASTVSNCFPDRTTSTLVNGCDDDNSDIGDPVRIENDDSDQKSSFINPQNTNNYANHAFKGASTNGRVDSDFDSGTSKSNGSQYNDYINQTYVDNSRRQSVQNDDESQLENVRLLIDSVPAIKPYRSDHHKSTINPTKLPYVVNAKEKLPRSIVKSPSSNSFNKNPKDKARHRLSLQCPQNSANGSTDQASDAPGDYERPVLHVQFMSDDHGIPNATSISDRRSDCKSPLGSITSNSSSASGTTSTSSSSSSDDDASSIGQYSEARAPDGGWGWVVVFASFMVNLIADGITFSFGVIFVEFLNYFGEGKAKTAWIGSLFMAIPLLSGPIASFLTDRYGCRKVTIAGSILASAGFVISSFANSMEMLFFTFGILAGFGLSLCYVAAVVIVAYYFEKKRSFATGLSVCGSGIGTFIFAPLTSMLLEEYGWRGTTLILAGIFLNMTVCGMLMRDLEWTTHRAKLKRKERKRSKLGVSADSFSVSNSTNTGGTASNLNQQTNSDVPNVMEINGVKVEDLGDPRLFSSLVTLPTFMRNGEKVPIEVMELLSTHRNVHNLMQTYPGLLSSRSFSEPHSSHTGIAAPEGHLSPSNPEHAKVSKKKPPTNTEQFHKEQALITWIRKNENHHHRDHRAPPSSSYLKDLRMHRHSLTYRGAMLNINRYRLRASSCPDIYRNSMTTIAKEKSQWHQGIAEFKNLFVDILDFSYFADIRFLLFAVSNFLLYTWYDVPYVYLTDNAIEMGIPESDASMLIGIIGIVNMFGEIGLGWVGDVKGISPSTVYAVCMALCGAVTAMVPISSSYTWLCSMSGFFGLFIAANYSLTSIILVELITLERFTNAYGLLLLVQGVANLVGPPLAGWIYDVTGTYDLSFYIAGIFISMSGGILVILPAIGKYRKYRSLKARTSSDRCETPKIPNESKINKCNGTTKAVLNDSYKNELIKDTVQPNHV